MYMKDSEIVSKYKKADNRMEMWQILADLNGCTKEAMKDFLIAHGIPESDFAKDKRGRKPKVKKIVDVHLDIKEDKETGMGRVVSREELADEVDVAQTKEDNKEPTGMISIPPSVKKACEKRIDKIYDQIRELTFEFEEIQHFLKGAVENEAS